MSWELWFFLSAFALWSLYAVLRDRLGDVVDEGLWYALVWLAAGGALYWAWLRLALRNMGQ